MNFLPFFLFFMYSAFASAGLFTRYELQTTRRDSAGQGIGQTPEREGSLMQVRQKTLFARRTQFERQRTHLEKSQRVAAPMNALRPKSPPKPEKLKCSRFKQSCMPQSGCCDTCAICHCRFFNTICFCLRKNAQCPIKA